MNWTFLMCLVLVLACGEGVDPSQAQCMIDDDCDERPYGRCTAYRTCFYDGCWRDSDCGDSAICVCPDHPQHIFNGATCVSADCQTDDDCDGDALCRPSGSRCDGFGIEGYHCDAAGDECTSDADCITVRSDSYCWYDSELSHRRCRQKEGCIPAG